MDNDIIYMERWKRDGLNHLEQQVNYTRYHLQYDKSLKVEENLRVMDTAQNAVFQVEFTYVFYGNGEVMVTQNTVPLKPLPVLPCIGMRFLVSSELEELTWFGKGPFETYPDRKQGAKIGVYKGSVESQFTPYIFPQETGNKTNVRWASLRGDTCKLAFHGNTFFDFCALHYSQEMLELAGHIEELSRNDDIFVNLNHQMAGIGNGSLRAETLQAYRVFPEKTEYTILIKPSKERTGGR